MLKFIKSEPNKVFNVGISKGSKCLTRIRLGLNCLVDHKFRYNFHYCVNPRCSGGKEIETSTHFLPLCFNYHCSRQTLFEKKKIDSDTMTQNKQLNFLY